MLRDSNSECEKRCLDNVTKETWIDNTELFIFDWDVEQTQMIARCSDLDDMF